jgi:hypothetical protein
VRLVHRPHFVALIAAVAALAATATPASAQTSQPTGPWDGSNPFNCVNQDVGATTDFPYPNADPFCVEFDKTSQNVTDFGIADFASEEPARTAAASPKCFYYQHDHWTGSVVQGQEPEIWHWDGEYYFDKAKGTGGVSIHNFRIGGQPADMRPYVPDAYKPYFNADGGGVTVVNDQGPDPSCIAKVDTPRERRRVYRSGGHSYRPCIPPGGRIGRDHVGFADLDARRKALHKRLGDPRTAKPNIDRWCMVGAASLSVAYSQERRAELIRTTARGQTVDGVGPGSRAAAAKRSLHLEHRFSIGRTNVLAASRRRGARLFAGIAGGKVRWLALAAKGLDDSRARADLGGAG